MPLAMHGATKFWVIVVAVWVVAYLLSLLLHPNRGCHTCKGGGRHRGSIFQYAERYCRSCNGSGQHPRWGTRVYRWMRR